MSACTTTNYGGRAIISGTDMQGQKFVQAARPNLSRMAYDIIQRAHYLPPIALEQIKEGEQHVRGTD